MVSSSFCEQCGAVLSGGSSFCSECGAAVAGDTQTGQSSCTGCGTAVGPDDDFCAECGKATGQGESISDLRQHMDYSSLNFSLNFLSGGESELQRAYDDSETGVTLSLIKSGRYELGLILTDLSKLREQFGDRYGEFEQILQQHLVHAAGNRTMYLLLDVSDNVISSASSPDWKAVVQIMAGADEYLKAPLNREAGRILILGDDHIIPMARFPNYLWMDPDREVESDLIYSTLADADPWLHAHKALVPKKQVGRIPLGETFGLTQYAHYLSNLSECQWQPPNVRKVSGISAKVWEMASQTMYSRMGGGMVVTSPNVSLETVLQAMDADAAIHYFNLHGTDTDAFWYGEENFKYPRTYSPDAVQQLSSYNAIGVEACYGAKFIGCNMADSILLMSLSQKTLGFLGSSKIAFGPAIPPNSLADVIIGEFLLGVQAGETFGQALNHARMATVNESLADGMLIKTLLSFNLFGDPGERLHDAGGSLGQIDFQELQVKIPDVLHEVRKSSLQPDTQMIDGVRSQMKVGIPEMHQVEPKIQRQYISTWEKEVYSMHYSSPDYPARMAVAYVDDSGQLLVELITK